MESLNGWISKLTSLQESKKPVHDVAYSMDALAFSFWPVRP